MEYNYPPTFLNRFSARERELLRPMQEKTIKCISVDFRKTFYFKDEFEEYVKHNRVREITVHCTDVYSYGNRRVEEVAEMQWFAPQL